MEIAKWIGIICFAKMMNRKCIAVTRFGEMKPFNVRIIRINMGYVLNFCHYFLLLPYKNMGCINKNSINYGKNQIQRLTGSGNAAAGGKESSRESERSIRV